MVPENNPDHTREDSNELSHSLEFVEGDELLPDHPAYELSRLGFRSAGISPVAESEEELPVDEVCGSKKAEVFIS